MTVDKLSKFLNAGISCWTDLIKLKRVSDRQMQTSGSSNSSSSSNKAKKSDAMIAKFAGGLCFDFNTNDSNMYAVSRLQ